jgi:hypothetical protein
LSLTTRGLVDDYLDICRHPLKNIRRWIRTSHRRKCAHEHHSAHSPPVGIFGLRGHPLHAVRGRMDTRHQQRHQGRRLSPRPGTGAGQYDQLRSFRAEGGLAQPVLRSDAECQAEGTASLLDLKYELAGILGYYQRLIAAALKLMSRADVAGLVRRLLNEQTLALRNAMDRHRLDADNHRHALKPALAPSKPPYSGHVPR